MINESETYPDFQNAEGFVQPNSVTQSSWTFDAPSHWRRYRLKHLGVLNPSRSTLPRVTPDTSISFLPMKRCSANSPKLRPVSRKYRYVANGFTAFQDDDLLIAKITPCFENGKGGIADGLQKGIGFGSTEFHVFRPSDHVDVRFVYYATLCKPFRELGTSQMTGSAGQQRVPADFIGNFYLPIPLLDEQKAIASYLHATDRKIGRFIRNRQRLIKVLNEQKQAIINRAVTRGLDPDVRLKPSGIDWLGDVPEHWKIIRNIALFSHRVENGNENLPVLQVSLNSGVTAEEIDQFGRPKRLIPDVTKYKRVRRYDLAYNTMRMWQGAIGVVPFDGLVSPAYVVLKPRTEVCSDFYNYFFRTKIYKQQVNRYSTGIVSDRNRLYWDSFKQMPNTLLPLKEQEYIVAYVQSNTLSLDNAIDHTQCEIDLIREYRTRLIADVVTGKVDVRHLAPGPGSEETAEMAEALEPLDKEPGAWYEESGDSDDGEEPV